MPVPDARSVSGRNSGKGKGREHMLRALDSAVAGLRAHQNKLDVISHNIANVNTYGYKSQVYSFKEAMYQTSTNSTMGANGGTGGVNASQYGYGTMTGAISTDMTASTPTYFGGFNATINGQGFFITKTTAMLGTAGADLSGDDVSDTNAIKSGQFEYTRVGQFSIDSNGYVVDAYGHYVYGFAPTNVASSTPGNPVDSNRLVALRVPGGTTGNFNNAANTVALKASDVQINSLGEITVSVVPNGGDSTRISLGKVAVATFQNQEGLTKAGESYYTTSSSDNTGKVSAEEPGAGTTANLMTGYLEVSNVDLAKEFSEMITTQRGFQANSKIITVSDEILNELVNMKR